MGEMSCFNQHNAVQFNTISLADVRSFTFVLSSVLSRLKSRNCFVPNKPDSGEIAAPANRLQHSPPTSKMGFNGNDTQCAVFLDLTAAYDTV